jgi:hypothetical protein
MKKGLTMTTHHFSIGQSLKKGFLTVYKHLSFLALLLVTYLITTLSIKYGFAALTQRFLGITMDVATFKVFLEGNLTWPQILGALTLSLVAALVQILLFLGITRIFLDLYEHGHSSLTRLFNSSKIIIAYSIASFIFTIFGTIGLLLLFVPGLMFITFYGFYDIIIVDQQCSPFEAFAMSRKLTRNSGWHLFGFLLISWLLTIISFGLLYPVLLMTRIDIYGKLRANKGL